MAISVYTIPLSNNAAGNKKIMVHDLTQLENASTTLVPVDQIVKKPFTGIVGNGGAKDPAEGSADFQHDDLKGMGTRIAIVIDGVILMNYGTTPSFNYNTTTGTISGVTWIIGSGLNINLNQ